MRPFLRMAILCTIAAMACSGTARAESAEQFFRGKSITMIISTGPGDNIDVTGRLIAQFLRDHIPGSPIVIPKNMPGAGHVLAGNYLYNDAPRDGTTIGLIVPGIVSQQWLGGTGVRYDVGKLRWVGTSDVSNQTIYVWHNTGITTLKEVMTKEVVMGSTGAGSYTQLYPRVLNNVVGTKFKIVRGYRSALEIHIAMERGEVQGRAGNYYSGLKMMNSEWLRDKKINMLAQIGLEPEPELREVPLIEAFAKNEEDRRILRLFESEPSLGFPIMAPPGIPEDRLAIIRKAFDETMKDPAFLREANRVGLEVRPVSGKRLEEIVVGVLATPQELIERARAAVAEDESPTSSKGDSKDR